MKFGKLLARCVSVSVPAWREKWIDYKLLKKLLYAIPVSPDTQKNKANNSNSTNNSNTPINNTSSTITNTNISSNASENESSDKVIQRLMNNPGEVAFYRQIRNEIRKVSIHFALCEAQLCEKYIQLITNLEKFILYRNTNTTVTTTSTNPNTSSSTASIAQEAQSLLAMVVKLSSLAIQLENYAVMNYCGFGKALKKHDKITGETTKLAVMQAWVNIQSFAEYPILLKLLSGIEEAWRLLVALQPEEASINLVDNDEAQKLMNLRHVKNFSTMHRAKEIAEYNTNTKSAISSPGHYRTGSITNLSSTTLSTDDIHDNSTVTKRDHQTMDNNGSNSLPANKRSKVSH